ncbi:inositol-pentakisphosphate 2-kinase [Trametes elegans]|nr:inositol-pentakisphosphate 2-kinase [Trametes elegans]
MTDTPHVAHTAPHDWKYISEGGSTIVFSYAGPPHPQFDGTALRLRKRPTPAHEDQEKYQQPQLAPADEGRENEDEDEGQEDEPDDPTIVFQRAVIERLLPAEHLPRLDAVRVGRAWLAALARATEPLRPPERRAKDTIDVRRRKAVLATDLVGGEGWAVEIKPKWGFLPAPTHLSPATRPIKTRTCRFCMHAHLKSTQGEDVALGYCPLDLFSGDAPRIRRALRALWDAWLGAGGAVNNLRVFVRGRMVKPTVDLFPPPAPAPDAPPDAPPALPRTRPLDALRDAFVGALLPVLLRTRVLHTLGTLQRTLDALDVEGLAALWAALRPGDGAGAALELGRGERDPDIGEWARFVDEYLARRDALAEEQLGKAGQVGEGEGEEEEEEEGRVHATEEELRFRLAAYLLSASFKDCSLILRLKPDPASHAPTDEDEDGDGDGAGPRPARQAGTVAVIDLDVKGVDRLAKWAALDRAIVDAYRGVAPRDCQDAWRPAS